MAMGARMSRSIAVKIVLAVVLITAGSSSALAWGWWDTCDGTTCYGPPYGNTAPPDYYVYDHQTGPTWTGNGWAYLPVGRYRPRPPEHAPAPPPPSYNDDDSDDGLDPPQQDMRRQRPMK